MSGWGAHCLWAGMEVLDPHSVFSDTTRYSLGWSMGKGISFQLGKGGDLGFPLGSAQRWGWGHKVFHGVWLE